MTARTKVTKRQAEEVLEAVAKQFESWVTDGYGPKLMTDFDGHDWVIMWEEGSPYQWTYMFPGGGIEEEFGFRIPEVQLPDGVWAEALTSYSLAVYPS